MAAESIVRVPLEGSANETHAEQQQENPSRISREVDGNAHEPTETDNNKKEHTNTTHTSSSSSSPSPTVKSPKPAEARSNHHHHHRASRYDEPLEQWERDAMEKLLGEVRGHLGKHG